jgi:hypothetical protein
LLGGGEVDEVVELEVAYGYSEVVQVLGCPEEVYDGVDGEVDKLDVLDEDDDGVDECVAGLIYYYIYLTLF